MDRPRVDDVLRNFPDSAEAVGLIGEAMRIAGTPVDDGDDDGRADAIRELLATATPAARTRACVMAGVLAELAKSVRALLIEVKAEAGDPDVVEGSAEITPDGWLVIRMGETEIGKVPFDPRRNDGMEKTFADAVLAEYVRMHSRGDLEVANFTKLPAPGKRTAFAILHENGTADAPPAGK